MPVKQYLIVDTMKFRELHKLFRYAGELKEEKSTSGQLEASVLLSRTCLFRTVGHHIVFLGKIT